MEKRNSSSKVIPSPKHRKQVFWQVYLPLILSMLMVIALAVLAVISASPGNPKTGQWASISLIWLIVPIILMGFVFLLAVIGLIYLNSRILKGLPTYTRLVHLYVQIIGVHIKNFLDRISNPVMGIKSWQKGAGTFWQQMRNKY